MRQVTGPDPAPQPGAVEGRTGWWRRLLHRRRPAPTAGTGAAALPEPTAHP